MDTEHAVYSALLLARTSVSKVIVSRNDELVASLAITLLRLWADKKITLPDVDPAVVAAWARGESDRILGKFMRGMQETSVPEIGI